MWENDPHLDSLPVLETELACQVDSHNPNDKSRLTRNSWLPYSHVPVFTGPVGGFHVSWWEGTLFHGNPGLTNPTDRGCHNPGFALDGLLPPKLLCNAEDLWRGLFFQVPATGATVAGTLMFFLTSLDWCLTSPLDVFFFFLQLKALGSLPRPRVRGGSTVIGSEGSGSGGSDLGCMGLPRSACKCASRC